MTKVWALSYAKEQSGVVIKQMNIIADVDVRLKNRNLWGTEP